MHDYAVAQLIKTLLYNSTTLPLKNEYQEYFLGHKDNRCVSLTTLPHLCVDCLEIWYPHLLEHTGLVQACNGIALPFLLTMHLLTGRNDRSFQLSRKSTCTETCLCKWKVTENDSFKVIY